jgi:trehalose-phosphatase
MTKPLHLPTITPTLQHATHIALFLDYDGTLVNYQPQPTTVHTPPTTTRLLNRLTTIPNIHTTIITGRTLPDIHTRITNPHINIAAQHGRDITLTNGATFHHTTPPPIAHHIQHLKQKAHHNLHEPGLLLEDKPDAIAFHYRNVPENRTPHIITTINTFITTHDPDHLLDTIHGAKVIELRPKGWNKGTAVTFILATLALPCPPLPIYLGDDTTDEDAFTAINPDGITIRILHNQHQPTAAQYTLNTTEDALFFLEYLTSLKTMPLQEQTTPQKGG